MTSLTRGNATSGAEVAGITDQGIFLLVDGEEYFLPFDEYPELIDAPLRGIFLLERPSPEQLCWPGLDFDLELAALKRPEDYPLVYSAG